MGLFRPYTRPDEKAGTEGAPKPSADLVTKVEPTTDDAAGGGRAASTVRVPQAKNAPTPTRRQAEAARMERLHPTLSAKEQKAFEKVQAREKRAGQYAAVDNEPRKVLLRNYIDAHRHLSEFLMPIMLLLMAGLFVIQLSSVGPFAVTIVFYVIMLAAFVDIAITWFRFRKLLAQRYPGTSTKGLLWYAINRAIQIRRFRLPKPIVKIGDTV